MPAPFHHHPASYRDPSGYIFEKDGVLYRQVNLQYRGHYDHFTGSGLYDELVKKGWLIPHQTINENLTGDEQCYLTLAPEKIPFISYPYEWGFDMLKDAALLTLQLAKSGIQKGMILKDATPYNIQLLQGKPVLIDSLSFEKYKETEPWIAYRQFCENFLAPLLLAHYAKMPLPELQLAWSEGIPLAVVKKWLPGRTRFSLHIYLHIHLHASYSQKAGAGREKKIIFSRQKLLNLLNSLEILVNKLGLPPHTSTWSHYYEEAGQRDRYLEQKKAIISNWVKQVQPIRSAADLGANTGEFSQLLSANNIPVIAADLDPWCINNLYNHIKKTGEKNISPVIIDLSRPSPAIGVNNRERDSFLHRCKVDLTLALALVHHLAIGKNIPFELQANLFRDCGRWLIIEFVPKDDEKVQLLLQQKKDIYPWYTEEIFTAAFSRHFHLREKKTLEGTTRSLYLLERIEN